jgi:ketosteroid isomerase-like protein
MVLFLFFQSCEEKKAEPGKENAEAVRKLLETDKAFSRLSEQKGMKAAYIDYIDSNGVLLKPGHVPVIGANAIDYLIQQNDTAFSLTRQPQSAVVAASGDLGYTYGVYSYRLKENDYILYGTYVSIWKKQSDGTWKFVLDSGNDGIGEQYVTP